MTSKKFNVLDHIDQLTPDGGSQTGDDRSFFCPLCFAKNYKINLKTGKHFGFGCACMKTAAGKQAVRNAVAQPQWQKPTRPQQRRSWIYKDASGQSLIEVHRRDDGEGNRKIWQDALQPVKIADLKQRVKPYRYQECLTALEQGKNIFWVEGESCADALWAQGIPATTTIGGSNNYRSNQYRDLFPAATLITGSLVICPDCDQPGLKYAEAIAADYPDAKWCYAFPESYRWQRLQKDGGADIADWMADGATPDDIHAAVGDKRPAEESQELEPPPSTGKPNVVKRAFHLIETRWGEALRYNEYAKVIELEGEAVDLDDLSITLAVEDNLIVNIDTLSRILKKLAKRQSYHPGRSYLEDCGARYGNTGILDKMAQRYFGTLHPIYDAYLKRTLIAAVARVFEPGCKVDTTLILQGPQGIHKSTFFQQLVGAEYFDGSLGSLSNKDEILKMHMSWLIEWAELENVFRRKDISSTKAFLSTCEDFVRPPYGRQAVRMPRESIIVGTTNQDHFLNDPTGSRRFWIIPVRQKIDLARLAAERDQLWGAAVALYQAGEQWHLTDSEQYEARTLASDYQAVDPWEAPISAYLIECRLTVVTTKELLTNCLELEVGHQSKQAQMRVTDCLKHLGWRSDRHGKDRRRVWVAPERPMLPSDDDLDQSDRLATGRPDSVEVGQAETPTVGGISMLADNLTD